MLYCVSNPPTSYDGVQCKQEYSQREKHTFYDAPLCKAILRIGSLIINRKFALDSLIAKNQLEEISRMKRLTENCLLE